MEIGLWKEPQSHSSLLLNLRKLEGDFNHFTLGLKYWKTFEAIWVSSEVRLMVGDFRLGVARKAGMKFVLDLRVLGVWD